MMRSPLSACIITHNEEDRIAQCIRSVSFCDEILVIDSHSTDATRDIARSLGARVIEHDWLGYGKQKQLAVTSATHQWVLCLDADEHLSTDLQQEIQQVQEGGFVGSVGYSMPRLTKYAGRWIRHGSWYPDRAVRLFNRAHGGWTHALVHEHVQLDAPATPLHGNILHEGYRSPEEHKSKIEAYTDLAAQEMHQRGRHATSSHAPLHALVAFIRSYVLRAGFLDGWRGWQIACLGASYTYKKYRKLSKL